MSDDPFSGSTLPNPPPNSFRDFEKLIGIANTQTHISASDLPLPRWYSAVREKPLNDFSVEDLAIACRQKLFPQFVLPEVISRLNKDPAVGKKYDWELLLSTRSIPQKYWTEHEVERLALIQIMKTSLDSMDSTTREDIKRFLEANGATS